MSKQYFAEDEEYAAERNRLELIAKKLDPISIRHLEMLQVGPGWDCLEIGAGTGSIAYWLAERVQPGGTVTATDLNTRFLDSNRFSNLTIRQHNMLTDDVEQGNYDLVHCRYVFSHLNSNRKCLEKMAKALRPGGILLIIDADWSFARVANLNHPDADLIESLFKATSQAGAKSGLLDPYCGGNLRERLEGIGFTDVNAEGTFTIDRGGSPAAVLLKRNAAIFKPGIIATGAISEQDFSRLESLLEDPSFHYTSAASITAWGRKPK